MMEGELKLFHLRVSHTPFYVELEMATGTVISWRFRQDRQRRFTRYDYSESFIEFPSRNK